ncbi:hypothetical protein [Leptospira weilii]|uniref:hypothetical protein n=1 Tax=Leptospira weilii TaxID=28184 RepID=UPI000774757F|nr:hypothetical protein [Leptospira weilii]
MSNSFFVFALADRIGLEILSGYVTARLASDQPANVRNSWNDRKYNVSRCDLEYGSIPLESLRSYHLYIQYFANIFAADESSEHVFLKIEPMLPNE